MLASAVIYEELVVLLMFVCPIFQFYFVSMILTPTFFISGAKQYTLICYIVGEYDELTSEGVPGVKTALRDCFEDS